MGWDLQTFDLEHGVLGNDEVANQIDQNIINFSSHYDKLKVPIVNNSEKACDYNLSNDVEGEINLSDNLNISDSVQTTNSYSCDTPDKMGSDLKTFDVEHVFSGNNEVAIEITQNVVNLNLHNEKPKVPFVDNSEEARDYSLSNDVEGDIFLSDGLNLSGSVQRPDSYSCDTPNKMEWDLQTFDLEHGVLGNDEVANQIDQNIINFSSHYDKLKVPIANNWEKACDYNLSNDVEGEINLSDNLNISDSVQTTNSYSCDTPDKMGSDLKTFDVEHVFSGNNEEAIEITQNVINLNLHNEKVKQIINEDNSDEARDYYSLSNDVEGEIFLNDGFNLSGSVQETNPYSCDTCFCLRRPTGIHTGEKPHKCTICEKNLGRRSASSQHIRKQTGEKPYQCNICTKSFRSKGKLKTHIRIHIGEKPYQCDTCKMCFNFKSNLSRHIRIHTGEKQYQCTICEKRFNQKRYLSQHMSTHTGDKPYQCNICKMCFNFKSNLSRHIRIHTGEKPYQCTICEKRFNQKRYLSQHMRTHTGDKPYQCISA